MLKSVKDELSEDDVVMGTGREHESAKTACRINGIAKTRRNTKEHERTSRRRENVDSNPIGGLKSP
jgi:hypothetical protein